MKLKVKTGSPIKTFLYLCAHIQLHFQVQLQLLSGSIYQLYHIVLGHLKPKKKQMVYEYNMKKYVN
jgi:predicted metal-dependent phosphotriesterase family hydrolase